jgi:hypothetical protein
MRNVQNSGNYTGQRFRSELFEEYFMPRCLLAPYCYREVILSAILGMRNSATAVTVLKLLNRGFIVRFQSCTKPCRIQHLRSESRISAIIHNWLLINLALFQFVIVRAPHSILKCVEKEANQSPLSCCSFGAWKVKYRFYYHWYINMFVTSHIKLLHVTRSCKGSALKSSV